MSNASLYQQTELAQITDILRQEGGDGPRMCSGLRAEMIVV